MPPQERTTKAEIRRRVLRTETLGLLLIALVIFIVILLRYGRVLHWAAR